MKNSFFIKLKNSLHTFLYDQYNFLFKLVCNLFALSLIVVSVMVYRTHKDFQLKRSDTIANKLLNSFKETVLHYNYVMLYMGKQISYDSQNLDVIKEALSYAGDKHYIINKLFAWTSFDWLDATGKQIYTQKIDVDIDKMDYSHRTYIERGKKAPWILHLCNPSAGITGGNLIIPVGMGILDKNGRFCGTLASGLDIMALSKTLEEQIPSEYSFVIFNENKIPTLHSANISVEHGSHKLPLARLYRTITTENARDEVVFNSVRFSSYTIMPELKYVIVVGMHNAAFWKSYFLSLVPYVIILGCISLFTLVMIYLASKQTTNMTRLSDEAERRFHSQINGRFFALLQPIISQSKTLLRCAQGEIKVGISADKQVQMLQAIYETSLKMYNSKFGELKTSLVNINEIVEDSVTIKYKTAMFYRINIKTELSQDLPEINVNLISIKQIITGILSLAIETTPAGGQIIIQTHFNSESNKVEIIIKDTGLGLDLNDVYRIKSISTKTGNIVDHTHLELNHILSLIEENKGECNIEQTLGKGRSVAISFFACEI